LSISGNEDRAESGGNTVHHEGHEENKEGIMKVKL